MNMDFLLPGGDGKTNPVAAFFGGYLQIKDSNTTVAVSTVSVPNAFSDDFSADGSIGGSLSCLKGGIYTIKGALAARYAHAALKVNGDQALLVNGDGSMRPNKLFESETEVTLSAGDVLTTSFGSTHAPSAQGDSISVFCTFYIFKA